VAELAPSILELQRAHQLLRRHGQSTCTRSSPACELCPVRERCDAGTGRRSLADPFVSLRFACLGAHHPKGAGRSSATPREALRRLASHCASSAVTHERRCSSTRRPVPS
jgi:adenine-specific DNA glycosylase